MNAAPGWIVAGGQVQQVEDDEGQHDGAAPVHGARGVGGGDRFLAPNSRPGRARFFRSASCTVATMCSDDADQQDDAHRPQQLADAVQKLAVGVQFRRTFKYLQIAQQVADDEDKQDGCR